MSMSGLTQTLCLQSCLSSSVEAEPPPQYVASLPSRGTNQSGMLGCISDVQHSPQPWSKSKPLSYGHDKSHSLLYMLPHMSRKSPSQG